MMSAEAAASTIEREPELRGHTVVVIGGSSGATYEIDGGQQLVAATAE